MASATRNSMALAVDNQRKADKTLGFPCFFLFPAVQRPQAIIIVLVVANRHEADKIFVFLCFFLFP